MPIREVLSEERAPGFECGLIRQVRATYGISLQVDGSLESSLPRWRKEWR